ERAHRDAAQRPVLGYVEVGGRHHEPGDVLPACRQRRDHAPNARRADAEARDCEAVDTPAGSDPEPGHRDAADGPTCTYPESADRDAVQVAAGPHAEAREEDAVHRAARPEAEHAKAGAVDGLPRTRTLRGVRRARETERSSAPPARRGSAVTVQPSSRRCRQGTRPDRVPSPPLT